MSNTPIQEPPAQELSSGSGQTLPSRPLQPISDPSASKRVYFYKSGDYKFNGHRMVINARTFKTFDALLDALSKKVPLPFGVRTITTPRGIHLVKALDELQDGGSYVCSDQKRVKPLKLDEINRRQVPWNTTRPPSAGRRRRQGFQSSMFSRRNEVITNRPAKVTERVAVRTPKRLVVIRNRDPTVKRTIVLQRRTAPTFDALLDYLSQILQFPVIKLYSTDGRRIDGLAGLILCSGVVVAAGNEPFRLGNHSFHGASHVAQIMYVDPVEPSMLQPKTHNKSLSSGRGSRNFSLSSERYIANQINMSRNGSTNVHRHHHEGSFETQVNHCTTSLETLGNGRVDDEHHACIVPKDDDIEKSFCVNQDGSMTVEMKVRLTIKEEEMLHWTTTLSRSSLSKGTVCASISELENSSPDSNNAVAKYSSSASEDETKEENHPAGAGNGVHFQEERAYEGYTSTSGKAKAGFKRTPTPGPRRITKKASVDSVKTVTESGVQENTLRHYSYMERMADGETTEGYCLVRHSSSSNRPIPKPRKTPSAGASKQGPHSSVRSSGVAEVLQIQNNGMEVTETVMHIYESQGCYDNYFANEEYSADGAPLHSSSPESKPSTDSGPRSSGNDCDIDCSWQPPTTDSLQRQKEEMLSLSSEPTHEITATNSQIQETIKKDDTSKWETRKKVIKPALNQKSSTSTSSSDKLKRSIFNPPKVSKHSSTDKLGSNASLGKKTSSESAKSGQKNRGAEKPQIKKASKDEKTPRKEQALLVDTEPVRKTPPKRQNLSKAADKYNGHNVNTPSGRPQMKKNMSDILQAKKSLLPSKKTISNPKSMTENKIPSPKTSLFELSEDLMPALDPSPSEIQQYVENWLEKVSQDPVPYTEEAIADESMPQTKVMFTMGGDSESDEKDEGQTHMDEYYPSAGGAVKKSASCLSVPRCHPTALVHNEQYARGLCVSMPSVRVDPAEQEERPRPHKSADNESASSTANVLDPKAHTKHVLRELYSSIHCVRNASETNLTSNLEKSSSLPDFSTQVASVFGSSCKAFMSFLSVMTLRDNLTGSSLGDGKQSRSNSEAMLMVESLQKISAIEDEEELRASLTDLQSRASSHFRERWKDFQILRERLESEPLSPRVSETEFALDVFSEGGDAFEDIDELMDELNMPQDLKAEVSLTIQHAKHFYPVEESTIVEIERNQSDTEEDVEKFVEECDDETKQSPEPDSTSLAKCITQTKQGGDDNGEIDNLKKTESVYSEQVKMATESEQELDKESEISQTEIDKPLPEQDNDKEEEEQVDEDREVVNDRGEDSHTKEIDGDDYDEEEETAEGEREREEEAEVTEVNDMGQEDWEAEKVSLEKEKSVQEVEEEMTVDEGEDEETFEEEEMEGVNKFPEAREDDTVEETDEREGVDEAEEGEFEVGEEENGEEWINEKRLGEEIEDEAEGDIEESDEGEEVECIIEEVEEEEGDEADEVIGETDGEEVGTIKEVEEEEEYAEEEEEKADEVIGETDGEEVGNINEEAEEEEEEEEEEKADEVIEETDGEEVGNINEEAEEEAEEEEKADEVIGETDGEEVGNINEEAEEEEEESEEEEEKADRVIEETDGEEVGNTNEEAEEEEESEEEEQKADEVIEESDGEEVGNINEEAEEEEESEEEEEKADEVIEESDGEEVGNIIEEAEEEEEEEKEADAFTEGIEEEAEEDIEATEGENNEEGEIKEVIEEKVEEEDIENITDEMEEEDEVTGEVAEEDVEEEVIEEKDEGKYEEEDKTASEENNEKEDEEEEEREEEVVEVGEDAEDSNVEERVVTDEEGEKTDKDIEEEEKCDEGEESRKELQETVNSLEEKSIGDVEEIEENMRAGQTLGDEAREGDEENQSNELNEGLDEEKVNGTDGSCDEENVEAKLEEHNTESSSEHSSECQCEDDKGNGTDTVNETDEGGEPHEGGSSILQHPVEISQELLDFVNCALQSSSLIFTYDAVGKIRIEPDNARVTQTKQTAIPTSRKDVSYGLKRLPSPNTSDLSDYRPETSESGGYKTQESVDIITESGDEASPVCRHHGRTNVERAISKLSVANKTEVLQNSQLKSGQSSSSYDSGSKDSKEDLSYFSAASSQKVDAGPATGATRCTSFTPGKDSADGVLIDQGRWLLKENHLIRNSPPFSLGMYGHLDSTSIDTGQENSGEDSPSHCKTQHNPLAAISSSELEEMAKPQTPKCTYYNMPHGSDSDPFLDDSSVKKDVSSVKGRGFRVSPTIDTSKTWASKNGSLSSFASVEFKIPDRKVHPEGESSAVTRARRTSSGGGGVLQAQDSHDSPHVRCGQYCPIL